MGSVHENDFETVTAHFVVDYSSEANRVLQADVEGAYTARYVYDDFGMRFSAEFTYADGTDRGTTNASGEYGENPASDMAVKDVKKVWFRGNLTGSSLYVVDENGDTVSHAVYDVWGAALTETATDINFTGLEGLNSFTGYAWDETLGLYYAQNRFYDAEDHRFTQSDPTEDGTNWYSYVENNPLIYTDPNGDRLVAAMGGGSKKPKSTVSKSSSRSSSKSSSSAKKPSTPKSVAKVVTAGAKAVASIVNKAISTKTTTKKPAAPKKTSTTVKQNTKAVSKSKPTQKNDKYWQAKMAQIYPDVSKQPTAPTSKSTTKQPASSASKVKPKKPTAANTASIAKYTAAKQQKILSSMQDPGCSGVNSSKFKPSYGDYFGDAMANANGIFAFAGIAVAADGPLPIGDVGAVVLIAGTVVVSALVAGYSYITALPSKSSSVQDNEKEGLTYPDSRDSGPIFPLNPDEFNPRGLVKTSLPGTKNGKIIIWQDPLQGDITIFEWDEDIITGPHYHALLPGGKLHDGNHYVSGTRVPPPLDKIYFGE